MKLIPRLSQAAFVLVALLGFLAAGGAAPRDLWGLSVPALVPLALLLAGAALAVLGVERGRRAFVLGGVGLLLLGFLDTSTLALTGSGLLTALLLVLAVEFAFANERAARVKDPVARAALLARYRKDAVAPLALVGVSILLGVGLFLVLGPLLPAAFQASLERTSAFGVLAGAALAAFVLLAWGLLARGLRAARRARARPAEPAPAGENGAAPPE